MLKDGFLQNEVGENFRIPQSQASRWLTKEHDTMKDEALKHRKPFRKGRRAVKYVQFIQATF